MDGAVLDEKTQQGNILKVDAYRAEHTSRMAFTSAMEQKEIAEGLASMPSVDEQTQLAISLDFRALHERIKNEGFYDCPYMEYGKEMVRYSLLFGTFIYFLRAEWYLTSACFLGMFWVCFGHDYLLIKLLIRCSNKSCLLHTTPATAASRATSSSTRLLEHLLPISAVGCRLAGGRVRTMSTISSQTCP